MRILLILFIYLPVLSFAQPFWQLRTHSLESQTIQREMDKMWKDKYLPVGMELYQQQLILLYINMPDIAEDYFMEVLDLETIGESGIVDSINKRLEASYIPSALSVRNNQLYIIYIKTSWDIAQWELLTLPDSYQKQEDLINQKTRAGFIPMALSSASPIKYLLCVQIYDLEVKEWLLKSYLPQPDKLASQIDAAVAKNWVPWGLMMNKEEIEVLYLKF